MSTEGFSELSLDVVTFEKDRQQVFEAMMKRPLVVSAMAKDKTQFHFELDRIERSRFFLILKSPVSRLPKSNESLTITFGLEEGQFFLKGPIEPVAGELYVIPVGESLYRMQRRNNFRAPVPKNMPIAFQMRLANGNVESFSLADISGGGLGILFGRGREMPFKAGDVLCGTLISADREPIELEAAVRHVWPPDAEGVVKVGVHCRNLGREQEKQMVEICLQIHRELFSIFRGFNR